MSWRAQVITIMRRKASSDPTTGAYAQIRSRILAWRATGIESLSQAMVVVLTSRRVGEGVSTVCAELGESLRAELGDTVLLIDSASGPADLVGLLGADCPPVTMARLQDERPADVRQLAVTGRTVESPIVRAADTTVLASEAWSEVLAQLRTHYSVILVDAGVLHSNVPHLWSRWATHSVLVIDAAVTSLMELERLRAEMAGFGIKLDGAILNKKAFHVPAAIYRHLF